MAANTLEDIRDRVNSVCAAAPFGFVESASVFNFDLQPTGTIDKCFRIEAQTGTVIGGFNYREDRTDLLRIWVARKHLGDGPAMYRQLLTDATSMRAAVIRDGLQNGGDYGVPDEGAALSVQHDPGREYGVLQLTIAVNYEAQA